MNKALSKVIMHRFRNKYLKNKTDEKKKYIQNDEITDVKNITDNKTF